MEYSCAPQEQISMNNRVKERMKKIEAAAREPESGFRVRSHTLEVGDLIKQHVKIDCLPEITFPQLL
ncbi:hypothetical protein DMENIID0001_156170 [Sergentomyia squamirostris]